jgi:sulfate permease, SulP family
MQTRAGLRQGEALRSPPRYWSGTALKSGLIVGLLTTVNTMSYAAVAGAPFGIEQSAAAILSGLIGAVVGGAAASLLGSVPAQVFAPRASVAVVIAGAASYFVSHYAAQPDAAAHAMMALTACLLLASLLQVAFSVLRLGHVIRLIPQPVTAGLTIAIAVRLLVSQCAPFVSTTALGDAAHVAALACAVATVMAIAWLRWRGREDSALPAGLGIGLIASLAFEIAAASGLQPVPSLQPHLQAVSLNAGALLVPLRLLQEWPGLSLGPMLPNLFAFALVLALVNSMETLTSLVVVEDAVGRRFDPNRALLAGAAGSLAAVCLGGLPVGGSAATSLVNARAGADARTSALVAAAATALFTLACGRWLVIVPMSVIAGMMAMVAIGLAAAPMTELWQRWRGRGDEPRGVYGELAVALLVCALLLATDMLVAVCGGLVAATALALLDMRASLVRRHYDANDPAVPAPMRGRIGPVVGRTIQIIEFGQPLIFATVEAAVRQIERSCVSMRFTVLDLRYVGGPDATAASALSRCFAALSARGHQLTILRSAEAPAIDPTLRGNPVFDELESALCYCAAKAARTHAEAPARVPPASVAAIAIAFAGEPAANAARRPAAPQGRTTPRDVERALLRAFGPLAPALLRRGQRTDPGVAELLAALDGLPLRGPSRQALVARLATRLDALEPGPTDATAHGSPPVIAVPLVGAASSEVTDELVERSASWLAPHLGPIAIVMARRAQRSAVTRAEFSQQLADLLEDAGARKAFLEAAAAARPL